MRLRTVMGVLICGVAMLAMATPAAAQGVNVDVSGGYQFFRFLEDGATNVPNGWGASVAVGNAWVKVVGDVGGHYKDNTQLHTFQGGLELSGKGSKVVPFVRILSGVGMFSSSGDSESVFLVTPEAGVKLMFNKTVGAQASVGFPLMFNNGDHAESMRVFAGIVIRK